MLRWRLLLGTLLIAALIGLCWLDYRATVAGIWLLPLAGVLSLMATQEVLGLAATAGLRPLRWTVYVGNLLPIVATWAVVVHNAVTAQWSQALEPASSWPLWSEGIAWPAFGLAVALVFWGQMYCYEKPGGNTANLVVGLFALVYVGLMLSIIVQMRLNYGIGALAAWVIVVKMGDTGAYTVGRLIGRHKMAPTISPGKTIEGFCGALAFSCLGAWAAFHLLLPLMECETQPYSPPAWGWLAFGILVSVAGVLGDLAESMLKRDVGCKDSSTWLPGFGGVLDILDSLLLSAPVAWACWEFGLVGAR